MSAAPSQVEDLELVESADGYIVYHPQRDRVHFLNATAAVVLTLCDGRLPAAEIAAKLQRLYELSAPPEDEVVRCLDELRAEALVR